MRKLANYRIIGYLQNQVFQLRDELNRVRAENQLLKKEIRLYQESHKQEWLF